MSMSAAFQAKLERLASHRTKMFNEDFLLTWQKSNHELAAVLDVVDILETMYAQNISSKVFDTGLAVSLFRDQSTRTRFSFSSAANLLGLTVQDLDEKKSQVAHGETTRETANMISFMTQTVGIRDDKFIHEGHEYMTEFSSALDEGFREGVLPQRPSVINLQCDRDHPTQSMADLQHLVRTFGSVENLRGKKIAMTWAYSPSYGKPLSVPQGIITLMTRFGMDVVLAHPEGYDLLPETEAVASRHARESGGSFTKVDSMEAAFQDADIIYPKSWAPFSVMEERTRLLRAGEHEALDELEKQALANNAKFMSWECNQELIDKTRDGRGLYMHCLPADITGVSCEHGEVTADVFEHYRLDTYREASHKPFVIAAMILLSRFADPVSVLKEAIERGDRRARG